MIGIVIPFHLKGKKHNAAYAASFKHYAKSGYLVHLCGSEKERSYNFAKPYLSDNVKYIEVPQGAVCMISSGNDVIRDKFNDSLKTLPNNLDWYCLVGADDLVDLDFFKKLENLHYDKACMAGVSMDSPLYLVNGFRRTRVLLKYGNIYRLTAGVNAFNKAAMDICGNRPYQLSGCETGAEKYFEQHGSVLPQDGYVVSVKGNDVLNSFDKLIKTHKIVPLTKIDNQRIDKVLCL